MYSVISYGSLRTWVRLHKSVCFVRLDESINSARVQCFASYDCVVACVASANKGYLLKHVRCILVVPVIFLGPLPEFVCTLCNLENHL